MKQTTKRIFSALLVLCMVLSILPTGVFAASDKTITAYFEYYVNAPAANKYLNAGKSADLQVTVRENGTLEVSLPDGYATQFRYAAPTTNGYTVKLLKDGVAVTGTNVTCDFTAGVARIRGCTLDELDETATYGFFLRYDQSTFSVSFGDDTRAGLYWEDSLTIPAAPEVEGKQAIGWEANGVKYLSDAEVKVSALFSETAYEANALEMTPVYADVPDENAQHIVLWTDSLTGEIYRVDTVNDGDALPTAPEVTKVGYSFSAWNDASAETVTGNMVIRANWQGKTVTVEYRADNGTLTGVTTATVGSTYSFRLDAEEGYAPTYVLITATGVVPVPAVLTALNGQTATYSATIPATDESVITIYGYTEKQTASYTHDFYADDDLAATISVDEGESVAAPAIPEKAGYNALYWTDGTATLRAGDTIENVTADGRWDAVYEAKTYVLNWYQSNQNLPEKTEVKFNDFYTVPEYTGEIPDGQSFLGWRCKEYGQFVTAGKATVMGATPESGELEFYPVFADNTKYWIVSFVDTEGYLVAAELVEQADGTVAMPEYAAYPAAKWSDGTTLYAKDETVTITGNTAFTVDLSNYVKITLISNFFTREVLSEGLYEIGSDFQFPAVTSFAPGYAQGTSKTWSGGGYNYNTGRTIKVPAADTTYTYNGAEWAKYTVFYYNETGNAYTTANATYSREFVVADYPTMSGFNVPEGESFLGWRDENGRVFVAGKTYKYNDTKSLWLYPIFSDNTEYHLVQFVSEGVVCDAQLIPVDGETHTAAKPADPTRTGYTFLGWYDGETPYDETAAVTDDTVYTARWTANRYNVNYVAYGDDVIVPTATVTYGGTFTVEEYTGEVDENKTFTAWLGSNGKIYLAGATYAVDFAENITLTPMFDTDTTYWIVNWVVDGAVVRSCLYEQKTGQDPIDSMPADPEKPGYTFIGWLGYTDGMELTGNTTFTAAFEANTYHVTLVNSDHVTLGILPESGEAKVDDKVVIGAYAESGYETFFLYARTASGTPVALSQFGGEPYDVPDANGYIFVMPADDVIVTVVEKANLNTVQFVVDNEVYAFEYVKSGEVPEAPAAPVKEGYTFIGWRAASTDKLYEVGAEFDTVIADETYTAEFEINTYDLTYYRGTEADESEYKCILELPDGTFVEFFNNDTANMPTYVIHDVTFGDTVELGEPMLPGYVFKGWLDESGYVHPAGAKYTMPANDVLLTAVWELDQSLSCLVRFVSEGQIYDAFLAFDGQNASIPAVDPVAAGKTFKGWLYGENTYANDGVKDFVVTASEDREMTFEAVWDSNLYTVTYNVDGDLTTVENIPYGEVKVTPAAPEKEGYTFVAWEDAENGAYYLANTAFTVISDRTFTAVWAEDEVEYTVKFFDENGNLIDLFVEPAGTVINAPAYEQGREDAKYLWVDSSKGKFLRESQELTVDQSYSFRAKMTDENEYVVNVTVLPADAPENVASVVGTTHKLDELVRVNVTIPEGYILKGVSALTATGAPVVSSLVHEDGDRYTLALTMPADDVDVTVELEQIPVGSVVLKFFDEKGNLVDQLVVEKDTEITTPAYEQGRPDATYQWVDEANNTFVAPLASFTADKDYIFRAVLITEAEYTVNVTVTPDDAPANVAEALKHEYKLGETAEVAINVPEGYLLKAVSALTASGNPVNASLVHTADGAYTYFIEMPADDVNVTVELWKIPAGKTAVKFMVDGELFDLVFVTKGENGTAPETEPTKSGYVFEYWQKDTTTVEAKQPFAVSADEENVIEFNAVFTQDTYIVDFDTDGGIPQPTAMSAVYGETIELPAAPAKTGSKFVGWREDSTGFVYGANGTYVVKSAAHFTAIWATNQYIVRFIDRETNQTYGYELVDAGATVTAPAGPITTGKTFVKWENEDGSKTLEVGNETEPIFADTTYYATYIVNTHNIAVVTDNCTVRGIPTGAVEVGTEITFSAKANSRYAMESVVLSYTDGLSPVIRELYPDNDGLYSFTMPDADVTVTATAVQNVFSIFTQTDAHCDIELDLNYAAVGESVLVTLNIDEGYTLYRLIAFTNETNTIIPMSLIMNEDGTSYYALTMPAEDITISATTKKADYTVTYLDDDNTLLAIASVAYNELADAPVAEKYGYKFVGWEILPQNGTMFDPATDKVTENLIVRAVYEGLPFTVEAGLVDHVNTLNAECTVSSGNLNSSNLLLNALTAEAGKDVYFTVAADYDYVITGVAIVGADGSKTIIEPTLRLKETKDGINYYTVTFPMPAENVKIDVYTAAKLFRVDVSENLAFAGDYTINGYRTTNLLVPQGEQVTIDIQPIPGYEVVDVTGTFFDGTSRVSLVDFALNADKTQFTFPMVARDVQVEITYAAIEYTVDVKTGNFETYKPDASVNPAKVVESLDPELTSKGRVELLPLELEDYTNANEQVYKIPANGTAIVDQRVCFRIVEYIGYELDSVTVTYDNGERTCPLTFKDGKYYFDMPADDVVITAIFTEKTYQVKKDTLAEIHGTVEMNGLRENIISVDYKNEVTVTVTPDDGYQVSKIYYVLADGTVKDFDMASYENAVTMTDALDHEHSITFHMPATTVTVCVEYAAIAYTIDDICAEATATYTTPHTVGEQVTFTTEANEGYIITKVYVVNKFTGERVEVHTASTNAVYGATYTFTMPAAPVTIHVETVEDEFNVVYLANGTVVDYEDVPYLHTADVASRVPMVENAPAGYHFVGWTSKEVQTPVTVPSVNNDDFVVVKKTYIVAAYEKDEIDVHFLATENGTVTETSTGNTAEYVLTTTVFGDTVNFTAVPDEGYEIDEVKVTTTNSDGYNLDVRYTVSGNAYSFVIPATYKANVRDTQAEDVVVSVTFRKAAYTLTKATDCGTDGTIAVNGKVTTQTTFRYDFQDEVTITATPNTGYYVASITAICDDGSHKYESIGTKPATDGTAAPLTLSFAMPACDLTFKVVYEKIDYSITCVFDAEQGKVETAPAAKAQLGDIVNVTVTPKAGYELVELTATYANGEKSCVLTQTAENKFTFTMPADAVVVTAVFDEITYTADLTVEGEADVTLNGFYTYNINAKYLDTVTVDVMPAIGWELVSVTVDGGAIKVNEEIKKTGGKYTFTMPEHDVKIVVKTEKTGYSLDAHALNFFEVGHGKVSLKPEKTAYVGDLVLISADPDDGYRVKEVVVLDEKGFAVPVSFISGAPGYTETWGFTMPAQAVTVTVYFEVQGSSYFTDVRTDHWFYDAVTFVTDRGYFRGIEDTLFAPYVNMDRAMFVTVIGRIYGVDVSKYTTTSFADVEANSWYAPYVAWASENGIVLGRDAKTFDPHADISREEMAAIMYRFCKFLGCDMTPENQVFMDRYTDAKDISSWAEEYVKWAVGVGLMRGKTNTTIDPLDLATRAEVAQVIKNLCDKVLYQ